MKPEGDVRRVSSKVKGNKKGNCRDHSNKQQQDNYSAGE